MTETKLEHGPDRYTTKPVVEWTPGPKPSMIAATVSADGNSYITLVQLTPDARAELLADIRAIVRSELDNMLELFDYYDALVEVIQSAPDDDADMKGMLLDWLREVRLS